MAHEQRISLRLNTSTKARDTPLLSVRRMNSVMQGGISEDEIERELQTLR